MFIGLLISRIKVFYWYCICGENWIQFYHKFVYDTWYASLTEEQKEQIHAIEEKKRKRDAYELHTALAKLFAIDGIVASIYSRTNNWRY